MRHLIGLFILTFGLVGTVSAEDKTVVLAVDKMTCILCPFTVSKALEGVEGVSEVDVDYGDKTATVTFDDSITDINTVASASTNAGYPATLK